MKLRGRTFLTLQAYRPCEYRPCPSALQAAEKVHAYTGRYGGDRAPSSRPKDLVDLLRLARHERFEACELRTALEETFSSRATHLLPKSLPAPPSGWAGSFRVLANQIGIAPSLNEG